MGGRGSSAPVASGGHAPRGQDARTQIRISSGGKEKQQVKEADKMFTSLGTKKSK